MLRLIFLLFLVAAIVAVVSVVDITEMREARLPKIQLAVTGGQAPQYSVTLVKPAWWPDGIAAPAPITESVHPKSDAKAPDNTASPVIALPRAATEQDI